MDQNGCYLGDNPDSEGCEVQSHGKVPQPTTATTFRGGSLSATNAVSIIHQMGMGKPKDEGEG